MLFFPGRHNSQVRPTEADPAPTTQAGCGGTARRDGRVAMARLHRVVR